MLWILRFAVLLEKVENEMQNLWMHNKILFNELILQKIFCGSEFIHSSSPDSVPQTLFCML